MPAALFTRSLLSNVLLTNSRCSYADFRRAAFINVGLGGIEWEDADLTDAVFEGVDFHFGTTRCGMVNSPIACEGSRTGFYFDDFDDHHVRNPDEVRVANLRGAKLTGLRVEGTDFYLVDLRGAVYSQQQYHWFQRCGAILE